MSKFVFSICVIGFICVSVVVYNLEYPASIPKSAMFCYTVSMALINDETKYSLKLAWFNIVQSVYSFPPLQRVVLIFAVLALLPGYWVVRFGAQSYYNYKYNKTALVSHASFVNPQPLIVTPVRILALQNNSYVAFTAVTNPNLDLAVFNAMYTFVFRNSKGEQVFTTKGQFYILPGKDQYILASRFTPPEAVVSGSLDVANIHWQKRLSIPEVKLITPAAFIVDAPEVDGIKVEGSVINRSPYVLGSVQVTFLLKDKNGKIVGVVQREERTLKPEEKRAFPQLWPGLSVADVATVEPIASTNTLDSLNLRVESLETVPVEQR